MSRKSRYLEAFIRIQQRPNKLKYLLKVQSPLEDYIKAYREVKANESVDSSGEVARPAIS